MLSHDTQTSKSVWKRLPESRRALHYEWEKRGPGTTLAVKETSNKEEAEEGTSFNKKGKPSTKKKKSRKKETKKYRLVKKSANSGRGRNDVQRPRELRRKQAEEKETKNIDWY